MTTSVVDLRCVVLVPGRRGTRERPPCNRHASEFLTDRLGEGLVAVIPLCRRHYGEYEAQREAPGR
jgi:hypothetical protein